MTSSEADFISPAVASQLKEPLTPALSPSDGERERCCAKSSPVSGPDRLGAIFTLSPSEGERARVRGLVRSGFSRSIFAAFVSFALFLGFQTQSVCAVTLVVTNTSDSGAGSLRQAILSANLTPSVADVINFNIPGAGPHVITPLTP